MSEVKRLAEQRWGEVQEVENIQEGIWEVECKYNSGYIVDFDIVILPFDVSFEFWQVLYDRSGKGEKIQEEEQHYAMFGESQEYILEYFYPELGDEKVSEKIMEKRPELA